MKPPAASGQNTWTFKVRKQKYKQPAKGEEDQTFQLLDACDLTDSTGVADVSEETPIDDSIELITST